MRIGFIGTGAMSSAIIRGAIASGFSAANLVLTDAASQKAAELAEEIGATWLASNTSLVDQVDIVVLGVKPQVQKDVITEITDAVRRRGDICIVSIAAGRSITSIVDDFGQAIPVIRVMPNVNALIGQSMSALCSIGASHAHLDAVRTLMNSVGTTVELEEKDFAVFSALAACSPAWVFQIIDSLARAGVKHGLHKATAVTIAAQAISGSADLVLTSAKGGTIPTALIDQVTSPGGTTIAGLLAAEESGLSTSLLHAVDAAVARDRELN